MPVSRIIRATANALSWVSVGTAVFLAIGVPGLYFALRCHFERGVLEAESLAVIKPILAGLNAYPTEMKRSAAMVRDIASENPFWSHADDQRTIFDGAGKIVARNTPAVAQQWPTILFEMPLKGAGFAGKFHVERSLRDALIDSLRLAFLSSLLAALVILSIRRYPVKTLQSAARELRYSATRDPLTGLFNRSSLNGHLTAALARREQQDAMLAVMAIDLTRFSRINDTIGHLGGNAVLREMAERIRSTIRPHDVAARVGGDEFSVVMGGISSHEQALSLANALVVAITATIDHEGHRIEAGCNIGIAMYPAHGRDASRLQEFSEIAMHECKRGGDANVVFYSAEMRTKIKHSLDLLAELRQAALDGRFSLHYHAICDTHTGELVGAEALIRLTKPDGTVVGPGRFIDALEQSGMIVGVGCWVIQEACRQAQAWHDAGLQPISVSVNVSVRQFQDGDGLVEIVRDALTRTGLMPSRLHLEITESVAMDKTGSVLRTLKLLKSLGVMVSIDDFGTGYSSLAYLKNFPVDIVKVDRTFIEEIEPGSNTLNIVSAVVMLAHSMQMKVVAEGVQNRHQLKALREYGCNLVQGFAMGLPLPGNLFEAEVMRSQPWKTATGAFFAVGELHADDGYRTAKAGPVHALGGGAI